MISHNHIIRITFHTKHISVRISTYQIVSFVSVPRSSPPIRITRITCVSHVPPIPPYHYRITRITRIASLSIPFCTVAYRVMYQTYLHFSGDSATTIIDKLNKTAVQGNKKIRTDKQDEPRRTLQLPLRPVPAAAIHQQLQHQI